MTPYFFLLLVLIVLFILIAFVLVFDPQLDEVRLRSARRPRPERASIAVSPGVRRRSWLTARRRGSHPNRATPGKTAPAPANGAWPATGHRLPAGIVAAGPAAGRSFPTPRGPARPHPDRAPPDRRPTLRDRARSDVRSRAPVIPAQGYSKGSSSGQYYSPNRPRSAIGTLSIRASWIPR